MGNLLGIEGETIGSVGVAVKVMLVVEVGMETGQGISGGILDGKYGLGGYGLGI